MINRCSSIHGDSMCNDRFGDYVDYDDHVAVVAELEARCAALAAENDGMKAAASCLVSRYMMNKGTDSEFIACVTPSKKTIGTGGEWDMWRHLDLTLSKTPATDAFLAEVRAHGVEMLADAYDARSKESTHYMIINHCKIKSEQARDFAAQLLQEVK